MTNYFKNIFRKIRATAVKLAHKKHFLDFLVATLTIPVLLTVLVTNIMTLQSKNAKNTETTTTQKQIIIQTTPKNSSSTEKVVITQESCKKAIGPISIASPQENAIISDNPVCITIKHDDQNYCSVVWSYRINGGSWSEYSSNSVCLYDVPNGTIKFDLRVQSTVSNDQESLARNFTYNKSSTASSSAVINQ
jgi:hypothetical protein